MLNLFHKSHRSVFKEHFPISHFPNILIVFIMQHLHSFTFFFKRIKKEVSRMTFSNMDVVSLFIIVCLLFYVITKSKVISEWVPNCDSAQSWRLYSAAPLGDQPTSTITWYSTQSHYPDTNKSTSTWSIPITLSTWLGKLKV